MNEALSNALYGENHNILGISCIILIYVIYFKLSFYSGLYKDLEAAKVGASISSARQVLLPWGTQTRSSIAATSNIIDMQSAGYNALRPGEIVMRILFADFTQQT